MALLALKVYKHPEDGIYIGQHNKKQKIQEQVYWEASIPSTVFSSYNLKQ